MTVLYRKLNFLAAGLCLLLCISRVGTQESSRKVEPRAASLGDYSTRDDFIGHENAGSSKRRARSIATTATITTSDPMQNTMTFANMNITDTRLSEFLIKVENSSLRKNSSDEQANATTEPAQISLNLSQNRLTNLQSDYFTRIKNLHELDVSQNRIVSMKLSQALPQLSTLNLSHNSLDNFPSAALFEWLPRLQQLDLSSNKFNGTLVNMFNGAVVVISGAASAAASLLQLDLSCNQFSSIADNEFEHLSRLLNLDLSFNAVNELHANTFVGLLALERLNLASNRITSIHNDTFLSLHALQFLDVSDNNVQIVSIRALQGIPNLIGLSIAYNELLGTSLQGFVATWSLQELDGSGIGLCEIPAALTQSVKVLDLADNNLQVKGFYLYSFYAV